MPPVLEGGPPPGTGEGEIILGGACEPPGCPGPGKEEPGGGSIGTIGALA